MIYLFLFFIVSLSADCFDGYYIGGNVSAFNLTAYHNDRDGFLTCNAGWKVSESSVAGGIQTGRDWQWSEKLFGVAFDFSATTLEKKFKEEPHSFIYNNHIEWSAHSLATLRFRAGIAVNNSLFYLTAGAAALHMQTTWKNSPLEYKNKTTRLGWVGGIGTEWMKRPPFSFGIEVLFMQFAEKDSSFVRDNVRYTVSQSDSCLAARFFMNYRL